MTRRALVAAAFLSLAFPLAAAGAASGSGDTNTADTNTAGASATLNYSGSFAFQRQGVFGCNLSGSYAMSVGALAATGGVYVPVNDAAVTLNTGYLVYKECVLRGIVDRMRESASSALQKQILTVFVSGRNGNPYYSSNLSGEQRTVFFNNVVQNLGGSTLSTVNPAFRPAVIRTVAQSFATAYNRPNAAFACGYNGDLNQLLSGRVAVDQFWNGLGAEINPVCNPYYAYQISNDAITASAVAAVNRMMTELQWGQGVYPITDANGNVVTPGSVVLSNTLQGLQTGFRQLENANDIDQMVGALFAGITSQVVGDNRGLAGLVQPTGSQPSYLDQVAKESAQGVRDSALNAAIQILNTAQQVETQYKAAMDAIGTTLTNAIGQVRGTEKQCWNLVIQNVCQGTPGADGACQAKVGPCTTDPSTGQTTCPSGFKLKVATSTVFSQQVVNAQIAPLASTTATNIQASAKALALIAQLLAGVTNTTSLDAQRVALQQLDNLVAQKALHNQYDAQAAQQKQGDIAAQMAQLIQDTTKLWADSTDTATGWCNVQQQAVISAWQNCWKEGSTSCVYPH